MCQAFHLRVDIDYMCAKKQKTKKQTGRGVANIEDGLDASVRGHNDYIRKSKERLIIANSNNRGNIIKNKTTRKQKCEEK